jgi:hypothetical protein
MILPTAPEPKVPEMPRQSAASRAFSAGSSTGTRHLLTPPSDLNDLEKAEFASLILGAPPNQFLPSDLPLLVAYSRAIVAEKVAAGELDACPIIDGKPSPWLALWQARIRAVTTLSRMLSLSPAGRIPSRSPDEKHSPASYYDRQSLMRGNGDEPDPN